MDYGFGFPSLDNGFGMGFTLLSIIVPILFVLVFLLILITMIRGVVTWNKNNHSPKLTVEATVVSKRIDVSHSSHPNAGDATGAHGYSYSSTTWYYVTFQVESGDRMELAVDGSEYGMLVEQDRGRLTFQGTRYLSFVRE